MHNITISSKISIFCSILKNSENKNNPQKGNYLIDCWRYKPGIWNSDFRNTISIVGGLMYSVVDIGFFAWNLSKIVSALRQYFLYFLIIMFHRFGSYPNHEFVSISEG